MMLLWDHIDQQYQGQFQYVEIKLELILILNMRKYQSNRANTRPDSQYSITTKKKSLLQQIPSFIGKALCHDTPKASLQFKSQNPEILFSSKKYDANIIKSSAKIQKNPSEKSEKRDKENKIKAKKSTKKNLKQQFKIDEKKATSDKNKTIEQSPYIKYSTGESKKEQNKKLNSLVTQYQQKELNTKTTPLKLQMMSKKLQLPYYISALIQAFTAQSTPFKELTKAHLSTSLQLLEFTKKIIKPVYVKPSIKLPKSNKNTIVFDLDQTLIHCNQGTQNKFYDVALDIKFPKGDSAKAKINIRPYAKECLQQLSQFFQIIIFTASHSCYANAVIDYIDPESKYVAHRFFRESCYHTPEGMYIKDLRIIDRPLNNMLLVDNVRICQSSKAAYSYCFQIQNGIPIVPFYDNKNDTELKSLTNYLKLFALSLNMKAQHCKILKTDKYYRYSEPKSLITQLYSDYLS